jgi:hypothetical protein
MRVQLMKGNGLRLFRHHTGLFVAKQRTSTVRSHVPYYYSAAASADPRQMKC